MAKQFASIDEAHRAIILAQKIFFTASAAADTRVNVSPRSTDHFHILGPHEVAYLDLTGSGSETAAHIIADGQLTIMFCAFDGAPMILRLYGKGRTAHRGSAYYQDFLHRLYDGAEPVGARQIVFLDIDLVQTSCGFAVPLFTHAGERPLLDRWASSKGDEGLRAYRAEKNLQSIDGLPTGFPEV